VTAWPSKLPLTSQRTIQDLEEVTNARATARTEGGTGSPVWEERWFDCVLTCRFDRFAKCLLRREHDI
jgi:hypothetical protein